MRQFWQQPRPVDEMGLRKLAQARVNMGMITAIDPADIDDAALQLAQNVIVRDDFTQRRPGNTFLTPLKPNNKPVLRLAFIKTKNGAPFTIRMTPTTIHVRGPTSWKSIVVNPALNGGLTDRFSTANILDKFIFTNNGVDNIKVIDFVAGTCSDLGNAPNYRYVIGFFNRAVGLARRNQSEVEVGWSADGDATEWNPATNPTAGSAPILESPDDLSDFIKGGVSLSNSMFILREKSIWLATKQPISTNPFYFYTAYAGIGGDCSYSLQVVRGGVCWADTRTKEIYFYSPGAAPQPFATSNKKLMFKDFEDDPSKVFSAFSSRFNEYTIYVPIEDGVTRAWTFNFDNKSWVMNEFQDVTTAANVEIATATVTIDDLQGSIEDLQGTIDELSPDTTIPAPFSYGRSDGVIMIENDDIDTDAGNVFTSVIRSKQFLLPEVEINIGRFVIEYQASRPGALSLSYSKDSGLTWHLIKTISITKFNKPVLLEVKRMIRARRFEFKLEWNNSDVKILGYECYIYPSSLTTSGK